MKQWERELGALRHLPGLSHVEVWVEYVPNLSERRALRDSLQGLRMLVHGPFIHLSLASSNAALRDLSRRRIEKAIDFAVDMDAKVFTIHGGSFAFFEEKDAAISRVADAIGQWVLPPGLKLAVENMPAKGGTTQESVQSLEDLLAIGSRVPGAYFTLDVGHCVQNGEDFSEFVRGHASRIADVQLHDAIRGGRGHLPAGKGAVDFQHLRMLLEEVAYSGFVSLENLDLEDTRATWSAWLAPSSHEEATTA
jgi:sugar phosphate isomerase/epimerase